MKKYLLALVMVLGLGLSAKGIDPFCVKNHGSVLLNDHQWHTLMCEYFKSGDNWSTVKISIRQEDNGVDYEIKDTNEDVVIVASLLLCYFDCDDNDILTDDYFDPSKIKIVKEGSDYVCRFTNEKLVPGIDGDDRFIGIDVFK